MLAILIIFISAIAKAAADTIAHHPDTSIFWKTWWVKEGTIIPHTKYKLDGWHLSNSVMIGLFISLIFIKINFNLIISYIVLGIIFIIVFNIFYNKIFRLKGWKT